MAWTDMEMRQKGIQKGSRVMGIFELADLFGVTTETLRKYEEKKVIEPARSENGYRKYSSWDLTKIICARQMRQEGFSLSDAAGELQQYTADSKLQALQNLRLTLAREIEYRQKLMRWLASKEDELLRAQEMGDRCVLARQARRYCCVYMVGDALVGKKGAAWENLKAWIQALPFVHVLYVGSGPANEMLSCLSFQETERTQYGLEHLAADFVIPQQDCVLCLAQAMHSKTLDTSEECVARARQKAERMGLTLSRYAMLEMIGYAQKDGVFFSQNVAMFPVEKPQNASN